MNPAIEELAFDIPTIIKQSFYLLERFQWHISQEWKVLCHYLPACGAGFFKHLNDSQLMPFLKLLGVHCVIIVLCQSLVRTHLLFGQDFHYNKLSFTVR